MANLSTTLPEGLNTPENLAKINLGVTAWSQLVAWLWTSPMPDNSTNASDEQKLKKFLNDTLQNQAKYRNAAVSYGNAQAGQEAQATSEVIKKLLMGEQTAPGITLTLPEVYKQLTTKDLIFEKDKSFCDMFSFEVIVDQFSGSLSDDPERQGHYIATLAYPPRPPLGEATVTEKQLEEWMRGKGGGDYLPPSAYAPQCGC